MEELIPISYINDFTFCPASIYFHGLIDGSDKMLYQSKYQIIGKSINLNQFKEEHFNIVDDRYLLDIRYNKEYVNEHYPNISEEELKEIIWKDIKEINSKIAKEILKKRD